MLLRQWKTSSAKSGRQKRRARCSRACRRLSITFFMLKVWMNLKLRAHGLLLALREESVLSPLSRWVTFLVQFRWCQRAEPSDEIGCQLR